MYIFQNHIFNLFRIQLKNYLMLNASKVLIYFRLIVDLLLFMTYYSLLIQISIFALLGIRAQCVLGFDIALAYNPQVYQCLKKEGFQFAIVRAYRSLGIVDANAVANLNYARAAGLDTDVYLFPCRSKDAALQVTQMMNAVPSSLYGMVWLDIQTNPSPNCGWTKDGDSNCVYIKQLVSAIKNKGKKPGIYASSYMWNQIFGNRTACQQLGSEPLWYAHYDNNKTFNDYTQFGGWAKPTIKQYNWQPQLCGAVIDYNYYP